MANPLLQICSGCLRLKFLLPRISLNRIVKPFEPRAPRKPRGTGSGAGSDRLSQQSKKVGDAGERIAFEYEMGKVRRLGFDDTQVRWLARDGETPGWDITSLNDAGEPIYIEVKASMGPKMGGLLITANERIAALEHGSHYHLYLVTDVMKLPLGLKSSLDPQQSKARA